MDDVNANSASSACAPSCARAGAVPSRSLGWASPSYQRPADAADVALHGGDHGGQNVREGEEDELRDTKLRA
eukprot:6175303-Pleurochrysis_carterae.AAC.3